MLVRQGAVLAHPWIVEYIGAPVVPSVAEWLTSDLVSMSPSVLDQSLARALQEEKWAQEEPEGRGIGSASSRAPARAEIL